jgi:hypothetical protein
MHLQCSFSIGRGDLVPGLGDGGPNLGDVGLPPFRKTFGSASATVVSRVAQGTGRVEFLSIERSVLDEFLRQRGMEGRRCCD